MLSRVMKHFSWRLRDVLSRLDPETTKFHEESVKFRDLMAANNVSVFEQMYSNPQLLRHYLVEERLEFYRLVAEMIEKHFPKEHKASAVCVDVGCGTGHLLVELRRLGFLGRLVGIDSAASAERQVKSHGLDLEFHAGYLCDYAWQHQFDLALCTEVLEHCEHPDNVVRDMLRVVKHGGLIVITVPDGRKDTYEGHIHFWSPESFRLFIDQFERPAVFEYFDNTNFCILSC